jgi:hypothetical protein
LVDSQFAKAASNGQRIAVRFWPIDPWDDATNGVPSYLWSTSAVTNISYAGTTWHNPNYNDPNYLDAVCEFIAAFGARYDRDERLAWFEFSCFGDWGEGDLVNTGPAFGLNMPTGTASIRQLGYWSVGSETITVASITQLVNAHLAAFPNTQLIGLNGSNNPEIFRQLMLGKNFNGQAVVTPFPPLKPVGQRYDGFSSPPSFYGTPVPLWVLDPTPSYYVANNDPIVQTALTRWQTAPHVTEQGGYTDYAQCPVNAGNCCISLVASQNAGGTTDALGLGTKYCGYRYAVSSVTAPASVPPGIAVHITATWTNFGVAPTYDKWQITYQLRNSSNVVVATVDSSLNLKTLFNPSQADTTIGQGPPSSIKPGPPLGASTNDTVSISTAGLAAGTYTVAVVVTWAEHKAGATYTWNYGPMNLALQDGPNSDGSYPICTVTVASKEASTTAVRRSAT